MTLIATLLSPFSSAADDLRRFAFKLSLLMPLVGALVAINLTVDPGGIFRTETTAEHAYARLMAEGHVAVAHVAAIKNWREVTRHFFELKHLNADVLLMGSSTAFEVRRRHFPGDRFYNLSMVGGNLEDYIIMFDLLKVRHDLPKKLILSLDPWLLLARSPNNSWHNAYALKYWQGFGVDQVSVAAQGGISIAYQSDKPGRPTTSWSDLFWTGISVAYFQQSIRHLLFAPRQEQTHGGAFSVTKLEDIKRNQLARLPDGSYVLERFAAPANPATLTVQSITVEYHALTGDERLELLKAFIDNVQSQGVKVGFFVPPLGPLVNHSVKDFLEGFRQEYSRIAAERGISIIGSPFGTEFGCDLSDFFGVDHPKESCNDRMFASGARL
jgi:hypothetical protein